MTTHAEAQQILERAVPDIDAPVSLLVRIVGCLESHYGDGWKGAGRGSNNWGAVTASKSWRGRTFLHRDSRWDPKKKQQRTYITRFRAYDTPESGARDLHQILTGKRHGVAATLARRGQWSSISRAIGPLGTGYYGGHGPPEKATAAHRRRFLLLKDEITGAGGIAFGGVGLALLAALLLWGWDG